MAVTSSPDTLSPTDSRIRQRAFVAALDLIAEHGDLPADWHALVASPAGCSAEQIARFFPRIEDVVFALYARLAVDLEATIPDLPDGTVAERFAEAMRTKAALVRPYHRPLMAVLRRILHPQDDLSVTGDNSEIIRARVQGVFSAVVAGASDCPGDAETAARLSRLLYATHLSVTLLGLPTGFASTPLDVALKPLSALLHSAGRFGWNSVIGGTIALLDGVAQPLVDRVPSPATTATAEKILHIVFRHRRLLPDAGTCADLPCPQCLALHLPKVRRYVSRGEPVHFLLPAFPAKSPSLQKVLGTLPDKAEAVALAYLADICRDIREVYEPGARITICSDGSVFSDLVGVSPDDVTAYGRAIQQSLSEKYATVMNHFALEDLFGDGDFAKMQDELTRHYAEPLELFAERIKSQPRHQTMFNGIHRFLIEEYPNPGGALSKNRVRELCKPLTLQVIQRSEAWGRLISDCFPAALRLSIHPQSAHAEKIGIRLAATSDLWITPWHGVAVQYPDGTFTLMKRSEAEVIPGAVLVESATGQPDYFRVGEEI
jgi:pyoverdine/dityrosine biosynthesis protein Dit1